MMASQMIIDVIKEDERGSEFHKKRTKIAEDLLNLASTYLDEVEKDQDGTSETIQNGVLWITSLMTSIQQKGNDSLANCPMLANMGELSKKMQKWFGWDEDLFHQVHKTNQANQMGFRLNTIKTWIETRTDPQSLRYYTDMTGVKVDKKSQQLMSYSVPRNRYYSTKESTLVEENMSEYMDSSRFVWNGANMEKFINDHDRYQGADEDLEWDQNSIWTEALHSFVSDPASDETETVEPPTQIQPPLTKNLGDRLDVLHQISGNLRCVAITTDNRPCPKNRMKNSMYCNCHQSLGSAFTNEIVKQVMNPDLIQHKYQIIRGVWVKTPTLNPHILSRRMKASLEGPIWEFNAQCAVMEQLLRKLFTAYQRRTPEDVRQDLIPDADLIAEFGKLKHSTWSQVFRSTREKLVHLGLDPLQRWTKYVPILRLHLGAQFGFMDPVKANGENEVEYLTRNWFTTNSRWSGSMDEVQKWNRGLSYDRIPVLNHVENTLGRTKPIVCYNEVRKADMNATPMFRYDLK